MSRQRKKVIPSEKQQVYDNLVKSIFEGNEQQAIDCFLPNATYQETLDIEVIRPILRVDRVYKVMYYGQEHILHIEFESSYDKDMDTRLLDYHGYLLHKYHLPVISVIIYLFSTRMVASPFKERSGTQVVLTFHFRTIALREQDAAHYMQQHAVSIYPLLPAMAGANKELIVQACNEMVEYYKDDRKQLKEKLKWLTILLNRVDTMPLEERSDLVREITMFDNLLAEDPYVQQTIAKATAKATAKAKEEEKIANVHKLQQTLINAITKRFSSLAQLAQQKVPLLKEADALHHLIGMIVEAQDEVAMRGLLNAIPPATTRPFHS